MYAIFFSDDARQSDVIHTLFAHCCQATARTPSRKYINTHIYKYMFGSISHGLAPERDLRPDKFINLATLGPSALASRGIIVIVSVTVAVIVTVLAVVIVVVFAVIAASIVLVVVFIFVLFIITVVIIAIVVVTIIVIVVVAIAVVGIVVVNIVVAVDAVFNIVVVFVKDLKQRRRRKQRER